MFLITHNKICCFIFLRFSLCYGKEQRNALSAGHDGGAVEVQISVT